MVESTRIQIEASKRLTPTQELSIVRAAFARSPSDLMRERLAGLLVAADAFEEIIELLAGIPERSFPEEMMLAHAYFARETSQDTQRAATAADRALQIAATDKARAAALATLAKAQTRQGQTGRARATLAEALELDPGNKDACKRITALELAYGLPETLLAHMDNLAAKGVAHSQLFAACALAHAKSGDLAAAREAVGLKHLHCSRNLPPPPGWTSIRDFNSALTEELLAHPALRYERYGTASEHTWRIDAPATGEAPHLRCLLDRLSSAIERHLDRIAAIDHPWVRARPEKALLRSWCVITESDGYESWHCHHSGWLSGVYYVRVPQVISKGSGPAGCLGFGLPPELAGEEAAQRLGTALVRPREGLMHAFPSHAYHRTFAHGSGGKRICLAFDLRPL